LKFEISLLDRLFFLENNLIYIYLQDYLENFKDQQEFQYASGKDSQKGIETRKDDKWWMPTVKVPPNGLSIVSRKWLEYQKELVNQVLKAAMAINAMVLAEMEIPEAYMEALPKVIF
jgi:PRONE (Plant-specific Rop nucleotide exchanger)